MENYYKLKVKFNGRTMECQYLMARRELTLARKEENAPKVVYSLDKITEEEFNKGIKSRDIDLVGAGRFCFTGFPVDFK